MTSELLNVQGLETQFKTPEGLSMLSMASVYSQEGETLGVVGESGCGKSVSMLSILKLIHTSWQNSRRASSVQRAGLAPNGQR